MKLVEFLKISRGGPSNGTFVAVRLTPATVRKIVEWLWENGIPEPIDFEDLHVTLLHDDEKAFPWSNREYNPPIKVDPATYTLDDFDGVLVLRFDCPELRERHEWGMQEYGLTWDYPEYIPHVSLSYGNKLDPCTLTPPGFPLYISHEYHEQAGAGPANPSLPGFE